MASVEGQSDFSMENISYVARKALKRLIAQGKAPIPSVYEAAFINIAEMEGIDGLVEFLYSSSGRRFLPERIAEEVGHIITEIKSDLGEYGEQLEEHNSSLNREQLALKSLESVKNEMVAIDTINGILSSILYANELMKASLENAYSKLQSRETQLQSLKTQTRLDPLTGALNRRALWHDMEVELARGRRYGRPFSIAMADLDHFKKINDQFGHLVGDDVLKGFVMLIRSQIRQSDGLYRYGGEEFVILFRETELKTAGFVVERIRQKVESNVLKKKNEPGVQFSITASFGVTAFREGDDCAEEILARADKALLAAKSAGRNRVVLEP